MSVMLSPARRPQTDGGHFEGRRSVDFAHFLSQASQAAGSRQAGRRDRFVVENCNEMFLWKRNLKITETLLQVSMLAAAAADAVVDDVTYFACLLAAASGGI